MRLVPIIPKRKVFDTAVVQRMLQQQLDTSAEAIRQDMLKTVKTWKNKPNFMIKKMGKYGRIIMAKDKIYFFVSEGTSVRYATMTPNFQAKTAQGRYTAGAGRGGVLFVNKNKPRPGIKARKFDKQTVERWRGKLPKYFQLSTR